MVHDLVSDAGGRIEVDSAPGAGAMFRITLPMADDHGSAHGAEAPGAEAAVGPGAGSAFA